MQAAISWNANGKQWQAAFLDRCIDVTTVIDRRVAPSENSLILEKFPLLVAIIKNLTLLFRKAERARFSIVDSSLSSTDDVS